MPTRVRTKIVATLGPASSDAQSITRLIEGGADVFRLNFSHRTAEDHAATLAAVREVSRQMKRPVAVLGDLAGPKIRLGDVAPDTRLEVGGTLAIGRDPVVGDGARVSCTLPQIIDQVKVGERVLIDDGNVRLLVIDRTSGELVTRVLTGGPISSHKGINLPDSTLDLGGMTEADHVFAAWAVEHELEYIGMSFVRCAADLRELRAVMGEAGASIGIVAKIERREAVEKIDEVVAAADAVMVARGDLGVEVDPACVPAIQKDIIRRCRAAARPVIVATQMLQSMMHSPTPTRAEVSDVANAVYDGADAVMLSGETAVGEYPVLAVNAMNHVAQLAEQDMAQWGRTAQQPLPEVDGPDLAEQDAALAQGAAQMTKLLPIALVVVWSETGLTAKLFSKLRLSVPVIALSSDPRAVRRMSLCWGVVAAELDVPHSITELTPRVESLVLHHRWAKPEDLVVIVGGTRLSQRGTSNAIVLHRLSRFMD